jgi:quercetin dioxygenase-like cupin family protein
MQLLSKTSLIALSISLMTTTPLFSQNTGQDHGFFNPTQLKWMDAPKALPKNAKIAVLEGDPSKSGAFTLRLKFPANYHIPPHWHPGIEHVTVISGNFYLGMGDQFNKQQSKKLPTGSFAFMPAEMHHFAYTKSPAIIQLHGMGPWGINYVNSQDDPRKSD